MGGSATGPAVARRDRSVPRRMAEAGADLRRVAAVRDGLPYAALQALIDDGAVSEREIETYFIPRRTLYARRERGTLSRDQGDLVVRIGRIHALALDLFGERETAGGWLRAKNGALGAATPLSLLDTEEGGRLVETVIGRIAHGIVE